MYGVAFAIFGQLVAVSRKWCKIDL